MRFILVSLAVIIFFPLHAQLGKQKNLDRFYEFKNIYDSTLGIAIYEKLNPKMGGDSMRYNAKGYVAQNWWEDYYKSGAVLHTGFYLDGQLQNYKNFYENGQIERDFHTIDFYRYEMTLWWPNGQLRSDIVYYKGQEESTKEYNPDGTPSYLEQYAKGCDYLMFRQSYNDSGKILSDLQLLDKKKQLYHLKEYYDDGVLQDEGDMKYYAELDDFMKEGEWKLYDDKGKLTSIRHYVRGQMTDENKVN